MNERVTEQIVRKLLNDQGYFFNQHLVIDEQISSIPKIDKLLKTASKKGLGKGFPEFLISSNQNPDFLIVIECKGDIKNHQSPNLDKYADYAVDGSILYASYLSSEYDVLAIGVSGQNLSELKITHHLFLKNSSRFEKIFGDQLLTFDNYIEGYIHSPQKFNQEYEGLLEYSKEINDFLHTKKVKESQRSLLISGILLALQNDAFLVSYKKYTTADQLAKNLIETISNQLLNEELPSQTVQNVRKSFDFFQTHTTLSSDIQLLKNVIEHIDININGFIKTYKYFDTIGQFYIEFLRYANNDKGLGIVLTPPHITELFCDLVDLSCNHVVLDNCCGTGGFLISALKKMKVDATENLSKIEQIKSEQLIGIEFQDDIFALAVSNMIIHGDGKSNIFQNDCFKLVDYIRSKYQPTIGFLNPPYKSNKNDIEEMAFILNNLDVI